MFGPRLLKADRRSGEGTRHLRGGGHSRRAIARNRQRLRHHRRDRRADSVPVLDAAASITGAAIPIDGGWTAHCRRQAGGEESDMDGLTKSPPADAKSVHFGELCRSIFFAVRRPSIWRFRAAELMAPSPGACSTGWPRTSGGHVRRHQCHQRRRHERRRFHLRLVHEGGRNGARQALKEFLAPDQPRRARSFLCSRAELDKILPEQSLR